MRRPLGRLEGVAWGRAGLLFVGAWGFAEAIAFPVIPDVAIGLLALVVPRRAAPMFAALLVGALAGSAVLYGLTLAAPGAVESMLLALPAIAPSMLVEASATVADGAPASMAVAGPGTPLKVYTYAWATGPATPFALAAGVVLNRVTRILPGVLLLALIGHLAPAFVRRHDGLVLVVYAVAYVVGYAIYWGIVASPWR